MDLFTVVPQMILSTVLLIVIITIAVFLIIVKTIRNYQTIPTFDQYKTAHPGLVVKGKVTCVHCGGNQLYLKQAGNLGTRILNLHICRTCGTSLYRSET